MAICLSHLAWFDRRVDRGSRYGCRQISKGNYSVVAGAQLPGDSITVNYDGPEVSGGASPPNEYR